MYKFNLKNFGFIHIGNPGLFTVDKKDDFFNSFLSWFCKKKTKMRLGFLLLIGLPGSGKTTFSKYLRANFQSDVIHFVHVCYDELIPNESYDSCWKLARTSASVKIENLVLAIKNKNIDLCPQEFKNQLECISHWDGDFITILDDNMYFRSMRYSLFQLAKKHRISFCQVFLNCSLDNALLKNDLRTEDSVVPRKVIENMYSKIEPPNSKNNWEKYSIELQAFCDLSDIFCKIYPTLNESLNNTCYVKDDSEIRELCKVQCRKSVLHQTDLALRKIINCNMKKYFSENPKKESKYDIAGLNLRKSEILSDIKTGDICLPDEILNEINSGNTEKVQLINFLNGYF